MLESFLRKYKNDDKTCYIIIISIILYITVLVFNIIKMVNISFSSSIITNLQKNFEEKFPISDIIEIPIGNECPENYDIFLDDYWEGYTNGCDCTGSIDYEYDGIYRGYCDQNQTAAYCYDIYSSKAFYYTKFNGKKLCKKREKKNYMDLMKNKEIYRKDNCPLGMKLCGKLDTTDNYLCRDKELDCPINTLMVLNDKGKNNKIPNDKIYKKIELGYGKTLYFSNKNATNSDLILTDIKLSEDLPCLNFYQKNTRAKSRYYKYILQRDYYDFFCGEFVENLKFDDRYKQIDSLNYYDLVRDSGIFNIIKTYPEVPYSSYHFNAEIYTRNFLGWRNICLNDKKVGLDYLSEINESINSIKTKLIWNLILISIYIFLLFIIAFTLDSIKWFSIVFVSLFSLNFILMIMGFINKSLASKINNKHTELISLNCGDKYTEMFMKYLSGIFGSLNFTFFLSLLVFLVVLILFCYPLIFSGLEILVKFMKKKRENEKNEKENFMNFDDNGKDNNHIDTKLLD